MTSELPHVSLEHVSVQLAGRQVLHDISFSVRRAEVAVVIGGSGAGKTTLARIVMGLLRPNQGRVSIEGEDISVLRERKLHHVRAKSSMVFQYAALLDSLSVFDNVALPLQEHEKLSTAARGARVMDMLESLELRGSEHLLPAQLSGGMRKRVALARALIRRPSLIVYDEPASGLDPLTARIVDDLILRTRERFGVTSLVISHDMAQASKLADRMHVLDKGQLVASGTPAELRADTSSLAARFFEASRIG